MSWSAPDPFHLLVYYHLVTDFKHAVGTLCETLLIYCGPTPFFLPSHALIGPHVLQNVNEPINTLQDLLAVQRRRGKSITAARCQLSELMLRAHIGLGTATRLPRVCLMASRERLANMTAGIFHIDKYPQYITIWSTSISPSHSHARHLQVSSGELRKLLHLTADVSLVSDAVPITISKK